MKRLILIASLFCICWTAQGQVGLGLTVSNDVYQHYKNPTSHDGGSAGSVLGNLGVGPKLWVGNHNFSVSAEAQAVWGIFGYSLKEYRGMGTVAYPIMVKLNFSGLTAMDNEARMGFSVGGGVQYSRTELYGTTEAFDAGSGKRTLFMTYVGQVGYGFGVNGFGLVGFARYGYHPEEKSSTINVGVQYNFNITKMTKIFSPESAL